MPTLTLIRGLPGSGKSTLAKKCYHSHHHHYEADQFFIGPKGYKFEPSLLTNAHLWCQSKTYNTLKQGYSVVVSNTFTTMKEMKPYIDMAEQFNYDLQVIHVQGPWKSEHDVPVETIQKMKDRWEDYDG